MDEEFPEPGGRKTPVPGTGKRGGACCLRGGAVAHPAAEAGGGRPMGAAGKAIGGATAEGTKIGWMPFGGGSSGRTAAAGRTPVVGTWTKCLGPIGLGMWFGDLVGGGAQWVGGATGAEGER